MKLDPFVICFPECSAIVVQQFERAMLDMSGQQQRSSVHLKSAKQYGSSAHSSCIVGKSNRTGINADLRAKYGQNKDTAFSSQSFMIMTPDGL